MAVGSMEIKQVQRTMNNGAVAEAEQVQFRGRYTVRLAAPQGRGATPYIVQYSRIPRI